MLNCVKITHFRLCKWLNRSPRLFARNKRIIIRKQFSLIFSTRSLSCRCIRCPCLTVLGSDESLTGAGGKSSRPPSAAIWCNQDASGRPPERRHCGSPCLVSHAAPRISLAGTSSVIRARSPRWPISDSRGRRTVVSVRSWLDSVLTKSFHFVTRIRRWQRVWKESRFRHSDAVTVQVSHR